MTPQTLFLNNILSLLVLGSNVFFLLIILAVINKKTTISQNFLRFLKKYSYKIIFILSLGGVVTSLIYSTVVGFEPCVLCWYQRIFLYPIAVLTLIAIIKKEKILNSYILSLAIPGALIALYHYSVTQLGAPSLTPCTSTGGSCAITYFVNFGYITIPFMAFSAFALIILIALADQLFEKNKV